MVYSIQRVLENTRNASLPGSSLEDPLGHLVACHGRIEERLQILEKAPEYLLSEDEKRRQEALDAIRNSIRYFDTSGVHHTEDEEQSVFPRLTGQRELLAELEVQHREAEQIYAALVTCAKEMEAGVTKENVEQFRSLVAQLAANYRPHIELENAVLIPYAKQSLSADEITAIRDEMRVRRGL